MKLIMIIAWIYIVSMYVYIIKAIIAKHTLEPTQQLRILDQTDIAIYIEQPKLQIEEYFRELIY